MAVHDTLGDFLTIIRNASMAGKKTCTAHFSKLRQGVVAILKESGYISGYRQIENENGHATLEIRLKYVDNTPAITGIERLSKPGRRLYFGYQEIPRVLGGLGINILTTSKGVVSDVQARREKLGGEVICKVW